MKPGMRQPGEADGMRRRNATAKAPRLPLGASVDSTRGRPWCVPPAMLRAPGENLPGEPVLNEIPDELGVLLWRAFRDVSLWAEVEPEERAGLFGDKSAGSRLARLAATDTPPAISASLHAINGMLTAGAGADAEVLTICCLEVASWARREGRVHTAVSFAQAGALASPQFAEAALHTGIAASVAGQGPRAETWLRRAVGLARRERDRRAYAAGVVELGTLYERRGDEKRAEHLYKWGYRAARRSDQTSARMRAAYGLFRIARTRPYAESAGKLAVAAFRAYRPGALEGADLLLDLARFWTDTGNLERARPALRRLSNFSPKQLTGGQKLLSSALAARAFGEADRRFSAVAASEAWQLVSDEALRLGRLI